MSKILENWKRGLGLPDVLAIDGHVHIGAWRHATTYRNAEEAAAKSGTYLDMNGIDAFCAVSGGYMFAGEDHTLGNDFLLEVWRSMPDRLIPFMLINPNDSKENILTELSRMYKEGVRCIKLLNHYQNYPGDGPNLMLLYEFASEHGMLVFNHAWSREEITEISGLFPDTGFICGHYARWIGDWMDDVLIRRDNVYTSTENIGELGWLERGIKNVGAGKFMLGSDGFMNSMSVGIGPVVFADISDDEKRMVLGLNVARLLDRVGALPERLRSYAKQHL